MSAPPKKSDDKNPSAKRGTPRFFPWRIFTRVILIQSVLVLLALTLSGLAARYYYKSQYLSQLEGKLKDTLTISARSLDQSPGWCKKNADGTSIRFTLISENGTIICDSEHGAQDLDLILERPEIVAAKKTGYGVNLRFDRNLRSDMYFAALSLPHDRVLIRTAGQLAEFYATVGWFDTSFVLLIGFFGLGLVGFAIWSGQKLVFPIGRLLLKTESLLNQRPEIFSREEVEIDSFGEWSDLESNIDNIRKDLEAKARSLDTERVELATIMGSISDAILAVDPEGVPLFFNSRFQLLFGREALIHRETKLWEVFRDPEILDAFNGALRAGTVGSAKTIEVEPGGGGRAYFSLSVAPLRRQDHSIYGAVGIFHDVSDLKNAEQMRIDFVANVSHELRTPLTSIKGYAETLSSDLDEKRVISREFLTVIIKNANRLMNLMEDLLDLSSIESDHVLQRETVSTEEVSGRVVKQLAERFKTKDQIVTFEYHWGSVFADPNRLEQVLVNLLDNAHKYTPAGGKITIRWDKKGRDVNLSISDTGPGVPMEHQSRLFERFYRVDKARSREQGGTGLGLAIVKHIMQRHEGRVWVESKTGQGSTFICRFPSIATSPEESTK